MTAISRGPTPTDHLSIKTSGLYATLYLHYGVLSFLPLWLASRSVPATQIGALLAIPLVLRLIAVGPVVAFAGRRGHLRDALTLFAVIAALLAGLTGLIHDHFALLVIFVFFSIAWDQLPVLADAYAVLTVRARGLDFGRLRVWGSLGVVGGALIGGAVFQVGGIGLLPWLAGGLLLLLALVSRITPPDRALSPPDETRTPGDWKAVFKDRQMIRAMFATSLIAGSHGILLTFGSIQFSAQGWSSTIIGLLISMGVLSEVIVLWFAQKMLKDGDPRGLILIAGGFAIARWTVMAFTPALSIVFVAQMLNGVSAMGPVMGLMLIIARRTPAHLVGVAQGVGAVILGLGLALVTFGSGLLWEQGPAVAYGAMALMAALGLPLVLGRETALSPPADSAGDPVVPSATGPEPS